MSSGVATQRSTQPLADAPMRVDLLGGFSLRHLDADVPIPINGQRLLAFLAIRGTSTRAAVAGTLWPEISEAHASGSLRTTMWRLQRSGLNMIVRCAGGITLAKAVTVDVHRFVDLASRILRPSYREVDDEQVVAGQAEILLGGELLPGWYEDWILFERERFRQLRMHALEASARCLTMRKQYGHALESALECLRMEPLRESARRTVVAIHMAEHNMVEALRHFEEFRALLDAELGLRPSEEFAAMLVPTASRLTIR